MSDLLRLTMYKNIVNKANISNNGKCCSQVSNVNHISEREEKILVDILNNKTTLNNYVSSKGSSASSNIGKKVTLSEMVKPSTSGSQNSPKDVLNSMAKPNVSNEIKLGQKVNIESLIGGIKSPKAASSSYDVKANAAVTINELAARCKKSSNDNAKVEVKANTGVKKSVIGNVSGIENLIPKISLNSIGKKNSF